MSFTEAVPGLRPGAWKRSLVVGLIYLVLFPAWPFIGAYIVGRNRGGAAEALSALPGISADGGLKSAAATFGILLVVVLVVTAVPSGDDTTENSPDIESTSDGVESDGGDDTSGGSTTDSTDETSDTSGDDDTTDTNSESDGSTDDSSIDSTDDSTTDDTSDSTSESSGDDSGGDDTGDDSNAVTVEIVDVVDGDTMDIEFDNGSTDRVRLLGVDTPEVHTAVSPDEYEGVPDSDAARQCLSEHGDEASAFATQEIAGETVQLQFDNQSDRRGSFDRLLVYIMYDGENFNHVLLEDGLARVYDSTFTESDRFYETEGQARDNQTGVWDCQNADDSSDGSGGGSNGDSDDDDGSSGASDSALTIAEIHEDAQGSEYDNLNDEYITFRNDGDNALDLSGWALEDDADHRYSFPDGFTLEAGAEVTVHTGSGDDTDTDLYWGQEAPVWNNGGDVVHVYSESGNLVIEESYE